VNFTDWREDICQQDDLGLPERLPHCHRCHHSMSVGGGECEDECFCDPTTPCNCPHCVDYRERAEAKREQRARLRAKRKARKDHQ